MELFHGRNTVVEKPEILTDGFYKDFGYGFYCTNLERQARRWALTKRNRHVVNLYEYHKDNNLNIKIFKGMSNEWLDFVVQCRRGKSHEYDIVEGPMADDTIWNYVDDFVHEEISRSAFWELVRFKYPTHQIVFCNKKALSCLSFLGSYTL